MVNPNDGLVSGTLEVWINVITSVININISI